MLSIGYLQGKSNPCLFYNPSSEVSCLVHGDAFLAVGEESALKQFKEQLAKEWKIKYTHICEAEHLGKHMRVLNRIVRIHPRQGITIEPDPRHAEILIRDLDGKSGRAVTTPMMKDTTPRSQWNQSQKRFTRKQGTRRPGDTTVDRAITTNWRMLRSRLGLLLFSTSPVIAMQRTNCFQNLRITLERRGTKLCLAKNNFPFGVNRGSWPLTHS